MKTIFKATLILIICSSMVACRREHIIHKKIEEKPFKVDTEPASGPRIVDEKGHWYFYGFQNLLLYDPGIKNGIGSLRVPRGVMIPLTEFNHQIAIKGERTTPMYHLGIGLYIHELGPLKGSSEYYDITWPFITEWKWAKGTKPNIVGTLFGTATNAQLWIGPHSTFVLKGGKP